MDPTAQFKENQKAAWSSFALFENMTGTVAPRLVSFAGIKRGATVLDVGCGTGVAGLTVARLGAGVTDIRFARDVMMLQMLSPQHYRVFMETNFGPAKKLMEGLDKNDPAKAAAYRRELEQLAAEYFDNNALRQDLLLTRAVKV